VYSVNATMTRCSTCSDRLLSSASNAGVPVSGVLIGPVREGSVGQKSGDGESRLNQI
jgi:hypothetical protein